MKPTGAKKMIALIVDDEKEMRDAMTYDFRRKGVEVLVAADGEEAFAIIQARPVDVVISDVRMPKRDGIELLGDIRRMKGAQPLVMFMSGYADIPLWEAYERGADAFFGKPFDASKVIEQAMRLSSPVQQRWSVDPGAAVAKFDLVIGSYDESPQFGLGRGGLFLNAVHRGVRRGDVVAFDLKFGDGSKALVGKGLVRWHRSVPEDGLSAGYGIEVLFLEPAGREHFVELEQEAMATPFIPKGPKSPSKS